MKKIFMFLITLVFSFFFTYGSSKPVLILQIKSIGLNTQCGYLADGIYIGPNGVHYSVACHVM